MSAVELERRTTQPAEGLRSAWPQDVGGYSHDPMPSDGPMVPKRDAGHFQQLESMTARCADIAEKIAAGLQQELDRALGPAEPRADRANEIARGRVQVADSPPVYRVRQQLERLELALRAIDGQANRVRSL